MSATDTDAYIIRPANFDTTLRQELLAHIKQTDTAPKPYFHMGRRARALSKPAAADAAIPAPRPAKGAAGQRFISDTAPAGSATSVVQSALTDFGRLLGDFLRGGRLDAANDVEVCMDHPARMQPRRATRKPVHPLQGRRVVIFYNGQVPDAVIDQIIDQGAMVALKSVNIPPARTQVRFAEGADQEAAEALASQFGAAAVSMPAKGESNEAQDITLMLSRSATTL